MRLGVVGVFARGWEPAAWIIRLALCLALLPLPAGAQSSPEGTRTQGGGVPVSVGETLRKDVPIWLTGLGSVQARNVVQIRARVDGTLMQVPVVEGQEVKQGDLLAVIDPRPFQAVLDAAVARKEQDEAQLASVQADLARYTALTKLEVASRQKLETVTAQAKQIRAAISGDAAQIAAAQLNLSYCYITAPFDGRIGLRMVDAGNQLRAAEATAIMTLAQLRPIAVTFSLAQDTIPAIADAMTAGAVPVVASAGDGKTELDRGKLLTIDNAIDPATGTIRVKATFPNASNRLWPGQFVNVRLMVGTDKDALTVPSAAVMHGPNELYVFAITAEGTAARQPVKLVRDDGTVAVLAGGVEPGQKVVTNGQSRLQAGARVAITPPTKTASSQGRPGS